MKIYIVFEYEAYEGGSSSKTVRKVYLSKEKADAFAAAQNGGRYMSWHVEDYEVEDAPPHVSQSV